MRHARSEKDIPERRDATSLKKIGMFFFFSIFFMPDYFGLNIGFALNMQRMLLLLLLFRIFYSPGRREDIVWMVLTNKNSKYLFLLLFICLYTMVYRRNISTLAAPLLDIVLVFFVSQYLLEYLISINELLRLIRRCGLGLCILGLFEFLTRKNLFLCLQFIPNMCSGTIYRDGLIRIMGPAHHPLGYGMFLLVLFPIVCYNTENSELDFTNNIFFELLILANVYMSGSRSTLGIFLLEMFLVLLFSSRESKKKTIILGILSITCILLAVGIFYRTGILGKILLMIANTVDGAFGTDLALHFFDYRSAGLEDSQRYRELLLVIFQLDWLNPWVGRGYGYKFGLNYQGYYLASIDNYYVGQYIRLAYPGLIASIIVFLSNIRYVFRGLLLSRKGFYFMMGIIFGCYFFMLWWADALGTLDYIFVLFAALTVQYSRDLRQQKGSRA